MGVDGDDLRDALQPLAGDPAEVWAAVAAALPVQHAVRRPILPWVAAAAAAGLIVGWGLALLNRGGRADAPALGPPAVAFASVGHVVGRDGTLLAETDTGLRKLDVGDPILAGVFVDTDPDSRGFLALSDDVELRLAKGTRTAILGNRSVELVRGRLFARIPTASGSLSIATVEGDLAAQSGAIQLTTLPDSLELVTFDGRAEFTDLAGQSIQIAPGQRVTSAAGVTSEPTKVEMVWEQVSWQVDMLFACPNRRDEALGYGWTLIDSLGDEATSARAELALRNSGELGSTVLGMACYELPVAKQEFRRRCWLLLAQVADGMAVSYLLGGISDDDPEIRVASVLAIERITGIESGRDAAFWRDAAPAERFDLVRRWRERLRAF